jgi:hypothetical protein
MEIQFVKELFIGTPADRQHGTIVEIVVYIISTAVITLL